MKVSQVYDLVKRRYKRDGIGGIVELIEYFEVDLILRMSGGIINRDSLKQNNNCWYFGEKESFRIEYDRENNTIPREFKKVIGTYDTERPFVCEINNVMLYGENPVGFTEDKKLILELCHDSMRTLKFRIKKIIESNKYDFLRNVIISKTSSDIHRCSHYNLAFPLVVDTGYYHWMMEYLPKIRALEKFEKRTGKTPKIIVQSDPPSWMIESLELVGVNNSQIDEWDSNKGIIGSMIISTHRSKLRRDFRVSISETRWLANRIKKTAANAPVISIQTISL